MDPVNFDEYFLVLKEINVSPNELTKLFSWAGEMPAGAPAWKIVFQGIFNWILGFWESFFDFLDFFWIFENCKIYFGISIDIWQGSELYQKFRKVPQSHF